MRFHKLLPLLAALAIVAASALFAYRYTRAPQRNNFAVLSYLPRDPDAVIFIDVAALRQSPFLAQLAAWLPQSQQDPDYSQFVADTGFNFERDLDHLAIAATKSVDAPSSSKGAAGGLVFIAEGRFDRQKLSAYALRTGIKDTLS